MTESTRMDPNEIEVRHFDLSDDEDWADTALVAWTKAARAAGIEVEQYPTNTGAGDGKTAGWLIIDGRLWVVKCYPDDPNGDSNIWASRPGPMCIRVHHDAGTDVYAEAIGSDLEEWAYVVRTAEAQGATIETITDQLVGWAPFASARRLSYGADEWDEVAVYMVEQE